MKQNINTNNSPKKLMLFNSPNNFNSKSNNYQINTKKCRRIKNAFLFKSIEFS